MQEVKLLNGKTVVIIGGAGLIGQAFSEGVVIHGGKVIIADIDIIRCQDVCKGISEKVAGFPPEARLVDITSKNSLDSLISQISDSHGLIHAVVNCAYPTNKRYGRKFEEVEYEDFCENINLHLGGYFLSTQRFINYFKTQGFGNIVNISSIYGVITPKFNIYNETNITMPIEYAAIKSAIVHMTKYIAKYLIGENIRINSISPGGIFDNQNKKFIEAYNSHCLNKGMLDGKDIANTLIFLLSDLSQYINGQNIIVDDGFSL